MGPCDGIAYDSELKVSTADGQEHTFPGLPQDPAEYDYAYEHAFIALPEACARANRLEPNARDRPGARRTWIGRVADVPLGADLDCGCGWVVFMHGSGGLTYDNWRYLMMMAAAGYAVLAPDSMAGHALGLRWRSPVPDLAAATLERARAAEGRAAPADEGVFWCADNVYTDGCPPFSRGGPIGCYASDPAAIALDPRGWRAYYERIHELRRRELARALARAPAAFRRARRRFLAGESEGGVAAAGFSWDEGAHGPLAGRVVLQWSCEHNYFVGCAAAARVCDAECGSAASGLAGAGASGGSARGSAGGGGGDGTPVLALISERDPFFSTANNGSVAARVARAGGPGAGELTGTCFAQLSAQGAARAASIQLPERALAVHGLTAASPNVVRALLLSFLRAPEATPALPPLLPDAQLCTVARSSPRGAVEARCVELGAEALRNGTDACADGSELQHHAYYAMGRLETCAVWAGGAGGAGGLLPGGGRLALVAIAGGSGVLLGVCIALAAVACARRWRTSRTLFRGTDPERLGRHMLAETDSNAESPPVTVGTSTSSGAPAPADGAMR